MKLKKKKIFKDLYQVMKCESLLSLTPAWSVTDRHHKQTQALLTPFSGEHWGRHSNEGAWKTTLFIISFVFKHVHLEGQEESVFALYFTNDLRWNFLPILDLTNSISLELYLSSFLVFQQLKCPLSPCLITCKEQVGAALRTVWAPPSRPSRCLQHLSGAQAWFRGWEPIDSPALQ